MAISLKNFFARDDTRRVIEKARADRPYIKKQSCRRDPHLWDTTYIYTCRGRTKKKTSGSRWPVKIVVDFEGDETAVCGCPAGTPPVDGRTGLRRFEPRPCYHVAATYIHHLAALKRLATLRARRGGEAAGGERERLAAVA